MLTENGIEIDHRALNQLLEQADVLTIGFTLFPERLLIDARCQGEEGPLVAVVGPVATVQERYLWLGKHRPNFGAPQAFSFFVWPHTVRTLAEQDVLAAMRRRIERVAPEGAHVLDDVVAKLVEREREAMRGAVRGSGQEWQTLWQRG